MKATNPIVRCKIAIASAGSNLVKQYMLQYNKVAKLKIIPIRFYVTMRNFDNKAYDLLCLVINSHTDEHPAGTSSVLTHVFFLCFLWQIDTFELFKQNFIRVVYFHSFPFAQCVDVDVLIYLLECFSCRISLSQIVHNLNFGISCVAHLVLSICTFSFSSGLNIILLKKIF